MTIDANELRMLAETADGLRNQNLVLVRRDGAYAVVAEEDVLGGDEQLLTLRTDDSITRAQRPEFEIELQVSGGPSVPLRSDYDAAFWSLSAIDKFVVPYYARIWPMEKVSAFRAKVAADAAFVIIDHPPGSKNFVQRFTEGGGLQTLTVEEYLELDLSQSQSQQSQA